MMGFHFLLSDSMKALKLSGVPPAIFKPMPVNRSIKSGARKASFTDWFNRLTTASDVFAGAITPAQGNEA